MFGQSDLINPKISEFTGPYVSYEYLSGDSQKNVLCNDSNCFHSLTYPSSISHLRVRLSIRKRGNYVKAFMKAVAESPEFGSIFLSPIEDILTPKGCLINCDRSATDILCALSLIRELQNEVFPHIQKIYEYCGDPILPYLIVHGRVYGDNHKPFHRNVRLDTGGFPYNCHEGSLKKEGWKINGVKNSWEYYSTAQFKEDERKILS